MKKKHQLAFRASLYGAMALFFLSMPFWEAVDDTFGYAFAFSLAAVFGALSFWYYKKTGKTSHEELAHTMPANATEAEKRKSYRQLLIVTLLAFPTLTLFIISDLNDLESHQTEHISIWAPVAFIYRHLGYWPAVLFVPVLGFVCLTIFDHKIDKGSAGKKIHDKP